MTFTFRLIFLVTAQKMRLSPENRMTHEWMLAYENGLRAILNKLYRKWQYMPVTYVNMHAMARDVREELTRDFPEHNFFVIDGGKELPKCLC